MGVSLTLEMRSRSRITERRDVAPDCKLSIIRPIRSASRNPKSLVGGKPPSANMPRSAITEDTFRSANSMSSSFAFWRLASCWI